jgi:uncharacterized protein (DUF608 family)
MQTRFPIDTPGLQWIEFAADGFDSPASGMVFHEGGSQPGVPLGGIGTGCVDVKRNGHFGRSSLFNSFAPPRDLNLPFAAICVRRNVYCLETEISQGTEMCQRIHYWGHYPVADIEYELNAPVSVGLRAWTPFLPGDAEASNSPIIFFEFQVRNVSAAPQQVKLVVTVPGPTSAESNSIQYVRTELDKQGVRGVCIGWKGGNYVLACSSQQELARGGYIDKEKWSEVWDRLPTAESADSGSSISANLKIESHEISNVHFLLAWYAPRWAGSPAHGYQHAYARQFESSIEVAEAGVRQQASWRRRVFAWQQEIYRENVLPLWLRDQLVNVMHTITRDSFWASNSIPRQNWYTRDGLFGLTESPRTTPHICNPSDWYGCLPVVLFYPDLMSSLLRSYAHFQLRTGEVPLGIGEGADFCCHPVYQIMHPMNSCVHIHLIDRLWQRDLDDRVLQEFYPSAVSALEYMQSLDYDGDGLPELDADPVPNQFYGIWPWYGLSIYVAGFWIAAIKMMERMAQSCGDSTRYASCRDWSGRASQTVEKMLWGGRSYLLYREPQNGRSSATILANQLVGQWCARLHSLPSVYPTENIQQTLQTILDLCARGTRAGLLNSADEHGDPDLTGIPHSNGIFTGECIAAGATITYEGRTRDGMEIVRRMMESIIVGSGAGWELPNLLNADGEIIHGNDFYQMMILWTLPLAVAGHGIREACAKGNFVDRILASCKKQE